MRKAIAALLRRLDEQQYLRDVPAQVKVLHHLVAHGHFADAERFIRTGGLDAEDFPVTTEAVGQVARLPYWGGDDGKVPLSCFVLADSQTRLRSSIRSVRVVAGTALEVYGWAYIENVDLAGHGQTVRAWAQREPGDEVALPVSCAEDDAVDEFADSGSVYCDYRRSAFTVRVPVERLDDGIWKLCLDVVAEGQRRVGSWDKSWPNGSARLRHVVSAGPGRQAVVTADVSGRLRIHVTSTGLAARLPGKGQQREDDSGPVRIEAVDVADDALRLQLRSHGVDLAGFTAQFDADHTTLSATIEPVGPGEVELVLPFVEEAWGIRRRVISSGTYRLRLTHRISGEAVVPVASEALLDRLPLDQVAARLRATVQLRPRMAGALAVVIRPPLQPNERGRRNQARLREVARAGRADERAVFFRTLFGDTTDDSARAIHDELRNRGTDLTLYWAVKDRSVPVPEGGIGLVEGSTEWHQRLGAASYVVVNQHQPLWYVKPEGQVMVQTFHGYPYKSMGRQWWAMRDLPESRVQSFLARAAEWDFLVSPSAYATPHLLRAFFSPEAAERVHVIEAGYPRNDVLLSTQAEEVRRRTREVLGITDDQTAVLYAPTFRDELTTNDRIAKRADFFDVSAAAAALGQKYVFLMRGHAFLARAHVAALEGPQIRDVTYYPDIAELCLASDAAVLDYSSLRFDYALTRKPMIFLVPDKDLYHSLRPAIMEFEPTAPGPQVTTTDEVITLVQDLAGLRRTYQQQVETFLSSYLELDDGHATSRVVDRVFGGQP